MNKKVKVSILVLAILIFSLSIGISLLKDNKKTVHDISHELPKDTNERDKFSESKKSINSNATNLSKKENEYYIVYVKLKNGASSFIPEKLNPGFKNDSNYNVSISISDNGSIINDEHIIQIDNFTISSENKKKIKKIAGEENYDAALREIQNGILQIKKSIPPL